MSSAKNLIHSPSRRWPHRFSQIHHLKFIISLHDPHSHDSTTPKKPTTAPLPGGVLQRNNIHLKVCPEGAVTATLTALRESPATTRQKAKFILATDGRTFEAENLADGETVACDYPAFPDHFGFFLPLAGITTICANLRVI